MPVFTQVDDKEYRLINELVQDAQKSTRLSNWESSFMEDMNTKMGEQGRRIALTESQWEVIFKIEKKMHST